ncbi:MAG: hypothetical protein ACI8QT_000229 [Halioglobus sp.]|jgi:hypothetical protein
MFQMAAKLLQQKISCGIRFSRLGAVFLVLFLSACSSTSFIYNRLDIILPWYLDDYVDLSREQNHSLDSLLQPFLRWHRQEELPQYALMLSDIEASLDQPVSPEVVAGIFTTIEAAWFRLEDRSIEWMFKLGDELSEEQISQLLGVLNQEQEEYEEKYLPRSDEEYQEESYDNFTDGLGDYLGRLSSNQREILLGASAELQRIDGLWLQERAAWLGNFTRALRREPGWKQQLRDLKNNREQHAAPEYSAMYAHNLTVIGRAIAEVVDSRSEKQDKRVRGKLESLREDFEGLIAQGNAN